MTPDIIDLHGSNQVSGQNRVLSSRSAEPLAARDQREHQRAATPVLPQRHRPHPLERRRYSGRRCRAQPPPPQDARLQDPRRSAQRAPAVGL